MDDQEAAFQAIVDHYMTIATADEEGRPWISPVWFATEDYREFFWVSRPEARHSRNIAARPDVAVAIFDSHQPPGTGLGVYLAATAEQVPEREVDRGITVFSRVSEAKGARRFARSDVEAAARLRLYHAIALQHFILSPGDERIPVTLP